jgi:predicted ester cyclase
MNGQGENLATIGAWNAAFNGHDAEAALACLAEDVADDDLCAGRAGFAALLGEIWSLFPDVRIEPRETVAAGNYVIERVIFSGTHRGIGRAPVLGGQLVGVPPTGGRVAVQHIYWWTVKNGKIAALVARRDDIAMMMQLGLLPRIPLVAEPAYLGETPVAHRNVAGTPEQERNLAVIRANQRAFACRDVEGVVETYADDARNHGREGGRDRMRLVMEDIFRTFTPLTADNGIRGIVAVDDCVVARFERTLRHTGSSRIPIDGGLLMGVPPTNRVFLQRHTHWWTLKDGLIVAHRACRDDVSPMIEFGLLPAPSASLDPLREARS